MSKPAKKRPTASAPATVPTTKSSRHSAGDPEPKRADRGSKFAFLAPDLVKAAIDGRLPHGMGVARLGDLPAEWSRQHQMLGLAAQ